MKEYTTKTPKETMATGESIAKNLHGGNIVLLKGDLGAGKTTLVKGIATGLGIEDTITSPTFSLMNMYEVPPNKQGGIQHVVHIDTYRLESAQELLDIGIEDYLGVKNTVCIIEWPEKIQSLLHDRKKIEVDLTHTDEGRSIHVR